MRLAALKFFALLFLLPGLAGLIVSATISAQLLDTKPRRPVPEQNRIVPRGIHGITIYQTPQENRNLNAIEYTSVGLFVIGLVIGVIYLEKWGSAQSRAGEENSELAENHS